MLCVVVVVVFVCCGGWCSCLLDIVGVRGCCVAVVCDVAVPWLVCVLLLVVGCVLFRVVLLHDFNCAVRFANCSLRVVRCGIVVVRRCSVGWLLLV